MFDRISDEVNCDKVVVDDLDSATDATQHLINLGCKKIALFSTIDNLSVAKLRAKGYYKALENNKIPLNENLLLLCDSQDDFDDKIDAFFQNNTIDAAFGLDEHSSAKAIKMGLKYGYKIPENLSIIGFADGVWSRRLSPSLSTVSQHGPEIGEAAAKMLIEKLESKEEEYTYRTQVIKTELRQRESTRKLK
jgi:LacI family transcriptional regulator